MTQPPTIAQLYNLTDRAGAGLTADEQQRLRDGINQLAALQAVARSYCPDCGRGDAAPTVENWETERQRANEAEAQLRLVDAMRQQNLDAAAAAIQRAETAEAAGDRVRRLADRIRRGVPWASNFDNLADRILTALDGEQPAPLTPDEEARLAQDGIDTPGCDCGHDGMGVSWHRDDCLWRRGVVDCPGRPTPG